MDHDEIIAECDRFADKWAPRLGIDRDVVVFAKGDPDETRMEMTRHRDYVTARVRVGGKILETDDDRHADPDLERDVVHELLHMQFTEIRFVSGDALGRVLGTEGALREVVNDELRRTEERSVDRLAHALIAWDRGLLD